MPVRAPACSHGQPSSPTSPTSRQAPWSTATPVSPGRRPSRQSPSAGTTRSRTCSVVSSPGTCAEVANSRGYFATASARVRPERSPTSSSRRRGSVSTRSPVAAESASAVCRARARSLDQSRTGPNAASTAATAAACARPVALSGTSAWPWARPVRFQSVSPCRTSTRVRGRSPSATGVGGAGPHVGRELDEGAVAPEPLEGVELPLLLVLHVDDDVAVVDQHPPPVALALAPDRLLAGVAELVLDLVDDRLDLTVVAGGGQQERVGDGELVADVEGDDVLRQLVGGRACGDVDEGDGVVGGAHAVLSWLTGRSWAPVIGYRWCLAMYWTTPSAPRYHTRSPRMVRRRP